MSTTVEPTTEDAPANALAPAPAKPLLFGVTGVDLARGALFGVWVAAFGVGIAHGDARLWAPLVFWLALGVAIVAAGTRYRWIGVAAMAVAFRATWVAWGLPVIDRDLLIVWLIGFLFVATLGRPGRSVWRLLAEWLPFAAVLVAYDYSRGAADAMGMPLQVNPQIDVDKFLFFGHVPTVWLQQHVISTVPRCAATYLPQCAPKVAWWEAAVSLVYLSHFIAAYVLAAWLWFRDHDAWWKFTCRFVTLSFMGVVTYALVPAAPPWMAAEMGKFGNVDVIRTVSRGFDLIHLHFAGHLLDEGQASVNLTAAVPSLHAAFSGLVAVTLWRRIRNRFVRVLIVLYPLWMGFALVLSAEHYVSDLILGWIYVAIVTVLWDRIDRRNAERAAAKAGHVEVGDAAVPATAV